MSQWIVMFLYFTKWSSVINLDLFWKQVFSYRLYNKGSAVNKERVVGINRFVSRIEIVVEPACSLKLALLNECCNKFLIFKTGF
jgi:hypothetical protein